MVLTVKKTIHTVHKNNKKSISSTPASLTVLGRNSKTALPKTIEVATPRGKTAVMKAVADEGGFTVCFRNNGKKSSKLAIKPKRPKDNNEKAKFLSHHQEQYRHVLSQNLLTKDLEFTLLNVFEFDNALVFSISGSGRRVSEIQSNGSPEIVIQATILTAPKKTGSRKTTLGLTMIYLANPSWLMQFPQLWKPVSTQSVTQSINKRIFSHIDLYDSYNIRISKAQATPLAMKS